MMWTRRRFLGAAMVAASGLSARRPALAQALRSATVSNSVSTFVYGQHLVAKEKKLFEEEGLSVPSLMDEPFGALDTHTKINLHAELLRLWEARRQTVVFVTHDLSEAITLADRIVVMTRRPGRIKLIHEIALPRPRDVIKLRASDEYAREYRAIWNVLGEEFSSHE